MDRRTWIVVQSLRLAADEWRTLAGRMRAINEHASATDYDGFAREADQAADVLDLGRAAVLDVVTVV